MITARNQQHQMIHIQDADKHELYTCPICDDQVIPRKGAIMPHHFGHKTNPNCIQHQGTNIGCIATITTNHECKSTAVCHRTCALKHR